MDYKFCPKCGGKLVQKSQLLLECSLCGYHFYQNPKACTAVIIENPKGEILLVKRFVDPKKGYWDLPGGFVDLNETLEESANRELKEELGVDIKDFKYIGSFYNKYLYQGVDMDTLSAIFVAKFEGSEFSSDREIEEIKFFKKEEIDYDKIAFEALKKGLKLYFDLKAKNP